MKFKKVFGSIVLAASAMMFFSCAEITDGTGEGVSARAATTVVTTESALRNAIANASAGDMIKLGSDIKLTKQLQLLNSGTSSAKINFNGGGYALDCSGISSGWGVKVNGSYWNICNMTVKNAPDCGMVLQIGGNNYIGYCRFLSNGDSGLQIYNGSHDNYVYKCESYYNYDKATGGENADGYACKLSGGKNNVFDGCIAKYNSDDGWDLYGQPYSVTIKNCEASFNGYINTSYQTTSDGDGNGFKLGSAGQNVKHYVSNSIAKNNLASGFDGNGNSGAISVTNCTSTGNKKYQWYRISGIANQ